MQKTPHKPLHFQSEMAHLQFFLSDYKNLSKIRRNIFSPNWLGILEKQRKNSEPINNL